MLNFALLGCGRIAKKHAEILGDGRVQGARLAAVCDVVPERARHYGEKYRIPWFTDLDAMMREAGDRIDVVNVLTPSGLHAAHCMQIAGFRKHVVVEKPMALRLADADGMIEACDRAGVRLFVVKQNRYNLPIQKLRAAIEAGRFGKIVMGTVRVRWCRTQEYYDHDAWRGTWALDGGVFSNQASHHVDMLEWMLGDAESVFAMTRTALVNIEVEDTGVALIRFRGGALGIVEATTATRPKDLEGSISILGEKGTVEVGGFALNQIKAWEFSERRPEDDEILAKYNENPPSVYGYGHVAYLAHVVESIQNRSAALVDGLEGRKSIELINAIYESAESGREVALRFHPKLSRLGVGGTSSP